MFAIIILSRNIISVLSKEVGGTVMCVFKRVVFVFTLIFRQVLVWRVFLVVLLQEERKNWYKAGVRRWGKILVSPIVLVRRQFAKERLVMMDVPVVIAREPHLTYLVDGVTGVLGVPVILVVKVEIELVQILHHLVGVLAALEVQLKLKLAGLQMVPGVFHHVHHHFVDNR